MIRYVITDWASNEMRFNKECRDFKSFDDAEEYLSEQLGDEYDTDREEYYIVEVDYD